MGNSDKIDIIAANDRFYSALTKADLELMSQVWLHADEVYCIHPGWDRLKGWEAVRQSWESIFNNQGALPIATSNLTVNISSGMALVSCFENMASLDTDLEIVRAISTNIFRLTTGNWKLIAHHSSLGAPLIQPESRSIPPLH